MNYVRWIEQWNRYVEALEKPLIPVYESHWHPNLKNYNNCLDELMDVLKSSGIYKSVVPSVDANKNESMLNKLKKYNSIYFAFAAHPKYIWKNPVWTEQDWHTFEKMLEHPKCVAVGETGLDYSYRAFCKEHQELQTYFCIRFIEQANKHKLPVILHLRYREFDDFPECELDAYEDFIKIVTKHPIKYGAVLHCYKGDATHIEKFIKSGISYFGIGGKIIEAEDEYIDAIKLMPQESILLETDSPYINTHPDIHGINTPLLLYEIAEIVARIRNTTRNSIIEIANANAERLFRN